MKTHIKKGDTVKVLVGSKEIRGKSGVVLSVNAAKGSVTVEGFKKVKKAVRPSEKNPEGGFVEIEAPMHISNVQKVD